MLLSAQGLLGPKAYYYFRVLVNWKRQMSVGIGPNVQVCNYWSTLQNDAGRTKGPIHLVYKALQACKILPKSPIVWQLPNGLEIDILSYPDYPSTMRDCAVSAIWAELASHRQGYAGLSTGLDYSATLTWPSRIKTVAQKGRMLAILQDGVWTCLLYTSPSPRD